MARRSRLEIYVDVLKAIAKGVQKPTRIMYMANLTWGSMQEFLETLINQGLVRKEDLGKKTRYEITDKGIKVLNYFMKAREMLPLEEIRVKG